MGKDLFLGDKQDVYMALIKEYDSRYFEPVPTSLINRPSWNEHSKSHPPFPKSG
jgi:hypothetical protein